MGWHDLDAGTRELPSGPEEKGAQRARLWVAGFARCDARSVWAGISGFEGYSPRERRVESMRVPVAIELIPKPSPAQLRSLQQLVTRRGMYDPNDRFWTASVPVARLASLSAHHAVAGWRLGLTNIPDVGQGPWNSLTAGLAALTDPPTVIGIIDHGIAVAHRAFRRVDDVSTPRLISLWNQDMNRRRRPDRPNANWETTVRGIGYGAELTGERLKLLIERTHDDERRIYQALKYQPVQRRLSHGTHVLDLAAGYPNPLPCEDEKATVDFASQSPIIAVQLPYSPAKDTSGSALCVHVLDALHYIVRTAHQNQATRGSKVVINLSDGAYGGAHDGHSMLERAIDDFLGKHRHVSLVLAAGNAHESRGHASARRVSMGKTARFDWRVLPDDFTDSFVEVWFDGICPDGSVTLEVTPPSGDGSVTVAMGKGAFLVDQSGKSYAALVSRGKSPDGLKRSMFLLALGPTRSRKRGQPTAPHGVWRLTVKNVALHGSVDIDAWIERDNPVLNETGPKRQSYFEERPRKSSVVDGQGTLGSLAGAEHAIVVGGHYRSGTAFSGTDAARTSAVARYSSHGPARAGNGQINGPDLLAPSDDSPVMHGLRASANRSGTSFRMDGTSVAAPLVTRRIVNLLGAEPSLHQYPKSALVKAAIGAKPGADPDHTGERGMLVRPGCEPSPPGPDHPETHQRVGRVRRSRVAVETVSK